MPDPIPTDPRKEDEEPPENLVTPDPEDLDDPKEEPQED